MLKRPPSPVSGPAPRRLPVPMVVFAGILVVTVAVSAWAVIRERRDDDAALDSEGRAATAVVQAAVDEALQRSRAVVGLFHASSEVVENEFALFVEEIDYSSGMFGLGFIARVHHADRVAFEAQLARQHPNTYIYSLDGLTQVVRADAAVYYPVQFFESPEGLPAWGFDVGSDLQYLETMRPAVIWQVPSASPFTWFPGRGESDGFVLFSPVVSPAGEVLGLVAAALDVSDLLAPVLTKPSGSHTFPRIVDASDRDELGNPDWVGVVIVANRIWLVGLDHTGPSPLLAGVAVFFAGLAAAVGFALATAGMRDRLWQRTEMAKLRFLNTRKNEFLATVSHELRTPLTSVLGYADELVAVPVDPAHPDRATMIRTIADEARVMEGIVEDLLAASRLEDGAAIAVMLELVPDLGAEVRALGLPGVSITDHDFGATAVSADRARLRQILRNLMSNAVRHGAPPIEVEMLRQGSLVEVRVRDHGPGVPEEMKPVIFEKYRSAPREGGQPGSTGLGLWLSRELARVMGGDLVLAPSEGGAVFVLTLPAASAEITRAVGF